MGQNMNITPLHSWHVNQNANMAAFGGYEMPLWYPTGAKAEHLAVITGAGLFDTSHMAVLSLHGHAVRALLQRCFSKDLERCIGPQKLPLIAGRCVYGVFLDTAAGVIDDAIVYQYGDEAYMIVVNASMGGPITAHLRSEQGDTPGAMISDHTDQVGKMDLQGPASARILKRILKDPAAVFEKMIYFSFKGSFNADLLPAEPVYLLDGTPVMVSRTGYTGEFGFELFVAPRHIDTLWHQLLAAGEPDNIVACGLAARDSLRAGAVLPLSHQDIGPWRFGCNPWLFVLPHSENGTTFTKDFIGAPALEAKGDIPCTLPFAGYDPRKIPVSDKSLVTDLDGKPIGSILTCTTDMAIDRIDGAIVSLATPRENGRPESFTPRGLCCGFVRLERMLPAGTEVVLTDGKRKLKVEIRDDIRPDRTARKPMQSML